MDKTIYAKDVQPGMTITDETCGIKRTLTVDTIEREDDWVNLWTAERGITCIRPDAQVTVEGDRPMSASAVGTILRIPGVGSIVKVSETDRTQWVDVDRGCRVPPQSVDSFGGVSVTYSPESEPEPDNEVTEVPDVVERNDWEYDNSEWRKHKWEDTDGDVWEWREGDGLWYVIRADGTSPYVSGARLYMASFPLSRVK